MMSVFEMRRLVELAVRKGWARRAAQKPERGFFNKRREELYARGLTARGKPRQRRPNGGLNKTPALHAAYMRAWRAARRGARRTAVPPAKKTAAVRELGGLT